MSNSNVPAASTVHRRGREILEALMIAQAHNTPLKMAELAEICSTSSRVVRAAISQLRTEGYPIASGDFGYTLTDDEFLVEDTVKTLKSKIGAMQQAASALEEWLRDRRKGGQIAMRLNGGATA